jgi:hypothetical protein
MKKTSIAQVWVAIIFIFKKVGEIKKLPTFSAFLWMVFFIAGTINIAAAAYVVEVDPNDSWQTAQNLDPYFTNIPNAVIETDANGNLGIPNASVYGFSGDSTYDYFSISVGTESSSLSLNFNVVIDIDFAEINDLDSHLTLLDTNGFSVLATNDDAPFNGPGDLVEGTYNSFLSYSFDKAGMYYIRVGEFESSIGSGGELVTDATYHLHVSSVPIPSTFWLLAFGIIALTGLRRKFKK